MIPLYKLNELPRSQRLRKSAKIFGEAERRFLLSGKLPAEEAEYLGRAVESLAWDEGFSDAARSALNEARGNLAAGAAASSAGGSGSEAGGFAAGEKDAAEKRAKEIRRALNTVYNILLAETGRNQSDWDFIESSGALDPAKRRVFAGMRVYLEDIRSPFNVGSMFRAAESFGAEKIWLSPLCASPRHKRAERTAMGCVDVLPWEYLPRDLFAREPWACGSPAREPLEDGFSPGDSGRPDGQAEHNPFSDYPLFALETGGTLLKDFSFPPRGILIAGSEELGVSPGALAAADASAGRVTIPAWGAKGSLNVAVAFGIVMHAWAEQLAARQDGARQVRH